MAATGPIPFRAASGTNQLVEAVALAEHEKVRVLLTRDGEPVAAVVSPRDLELLNNLADLGDLRELLAEWEAEGRPRGTSLEVVARGLEIELIRDSDSDL